MPKLIKGVNDFASQKPWAAKYWSDKNELKPDEVSANSNKKFWFDAMTENGIEYSWESRTSTIKSEKHFPLHKSNRMFFLKGYNDLLTKHPEDAKFFYKCGEEDNPSNVHFNSNLEVTWVCNKDHQYTATMYHKCVEGTGCPYCSGKKPHKDSRTAKTAYPHLVEVWSNKNSKSLDQLLPLSVGKFIVNCGNHEHELSLRDSNGAFDPKKCAINQYPELLDLWHPDNDISLASLSMGSTKKVKLFCGDHWYYSSVYDYRRGRRCVYCSGKMIHPETKKNSLYHEYPEIAKEYSIKNTTPIEEVKSGDRFPAIWEHSCGYTWETSPAHRRSGTGCPRCNLGWKTSDILDFILKLPLEILSTSDKLAIALSAGMPAKDTGSRSSGKINSWVRGKISNEEFLNTLKENSNLSNTEHLEELSDLSDDLDIADVEDLMDDSGVPQLNISNVLETISALDKAGIGSTLVSDEELVESMVSRWVGQIWSAVWDGQDVEEALKDWPDGNTFQKTIRDRFMNEFESVTQLQTPKGWPYSFEPSMMQKYVAVRIASEKRLGNWSGTGAGKTASAVLANLHLGSPETIVLCPNPVVSNWVENTKTLSGWHIFNFDKLSSGKGLIELDALIKSGKIGMVVVDELHFTKFRGGQESQRRQAMERLMGDLPDAYVLGMTATPVINNLQEAISLLEIIEGRKLPHLGNKVSMENVVNLHQRFIRYGVRYTPNYKKDMSLDINETIIDTDGDFKGCKEIIDHERRAVELKMDTIIDNIGEGGIIYCHYIDGIVEPIQEALDEAGLSYGVYTGEDKSGLNKYLNDEVDVLIGSSSIGTGIDGLQHKKPNLVLASMPWTDADYRQIVGRIYRQGNSGVVKIHIPQTDVWCTQRLRLIETKRSLSKAVMDGELPQANVSDEEVREAMDKLILRLQGGEELPTYETEPLDTDLISLVSGEFRKTERNLTDFQSLNRKWNTTNSSTLHDELSNDASEWYQYHEEYSKSRETWEVVPFKVFSEWLSQRKGKTVADLGCGEALLNGHENKVLSFDHVAVNDKVTVADISDLSEHLEDNSVDIAILSLALMGSNWNSYLDEALRITGLDSQIWIAETKTHVENWGLEKELESRGLTVNKSEQGKFVFFRVMV